mmetsp:Transcript_124389/g.398350  ORF Transcript_124389/g.398350 Transcript_124389/m.398350 type:complete len:222 (+) Transcript_124389:957-1622(+)
MAFWRASKSLTFFSASSLDRFAETSAFRACSSALVADSTSFFKLSSLALASLVLASRSLDSFETDSRADASSCSNAWMRSSACRSLSRAASRSSSAARPDEVASLLSAKTRSRASSAWALYLAASCWAAARASCAARAASRNASASAASASASALEAAPTAPASAASAASREFARSSSLMRSSKLSSRVAEQHALHALKHSRTEPLSLSMADRILFATSRR